MSGSRSRRRTRTTGARLRALLTLLLVPALLVPVGPAVAASAPPPGGSLSPQVDTPRPGTALAARPRPVDRTEAAAVRTNARSAPSWPAAGTAVVDLKPFMSTKDMPAEKTTAGTRSQAASRVRAGTLPVLVDAGIALRGGVTKLRVQTYDRAAATAAGVEGIVLRVDRADGSTGPGPARVSVDYRAFASAYGADWAARLRLVSLPACAVTTPRVAGCTTPTPLESTNDHRTGQVSATVGLTPAPAEANGMRPAGAAGVLVALTAGTRSGDGDYGATKLAPSATWNAGDNSGDFGWNYPIRVPPSLGGPTPSIALGYSSQSVDGHNAATNNQPSWLGEGFDFSPGYIERRYRSCAKDMDGAGHNNTVKTGDQCWETDNATVALAGHAGELIKDGTDRWHLRSDDGSLVVHKTGAGNGDNDGEWWVLTATNGTQYWFGGVASASSTWTVPVFGNDPGEPCRQTTFAASSCTQAWRWNLDFVVDTHGNTMSYTYQKESNRYGRNNTTTDVVSYDRGGHLTTISYGTRQGGSGSAPMQVRFDVADRCLSGCATHDAAHWPDVLWDQDCTGSPCQKLGPTFWTTKRLSRITTAVWDPAKQPTAGYRDVEQWTFTHTFPDPGDGTRAGLWLSKISHVGLNGAATPMPDLTFSGTQLQNRVDTIADQYFPMNWWRISRIDNETGGATLVDYAPQECVAGSTMPDPAHLENNTLRCFPVRWTPDGAPNPIVDFFHKYVVAQVREGDLTGGAPDVVHSYQYVAGAAWHYGDDDGIIDPADKTWSVWRGYGTVRTTTGAAATAVRQFTERQYFRGMNGDKLPSGTRSVSLPAADLNGDGDTTDAGIDSPAMADEDAYAGIVRADITRNGPAGAEVSATVNEPWQSASTATRTINATTVNARFKGVATSRQRSALDTDGGTRPAGVRSSSSTTTFDAMGMPIEVDGRGNDAVGGDESCTLTDYARSMNAAADVWLVALTNRVRTFAVGCATAKAGGLTAAAIKGDDRTLYDGLSFGATPTKGEVSQFQKLKTYGASPTYVTMTRSGYDANGRVKDSWDVDNNHTTTAYTPAAGAPVTQVVSTNQLGWTKTQTIDPGYGAITAAVDENGKRTDITADGLGRTTAVWLPGQDKAGGQGATQLYGYLMRTNGANAITTQTLMPNGGYRTSISLYDGLLRVRQAQSPDASIAGARLVTDTLYDSAGRNWKTTSAYAMAGNPSTSVYVPLPPDYSGPEAVRAWTINVYDGVGRVIEEVQYAANAVKWRTKNVYTGDRTDVIPPDGGTITSTVVDVAGNRVALREYHGTTPTGAFDNTTYTFNAKNQLTRMTDAAGNRWDYQYDLQGRQIQVDDPDKGRTTSTYDAAGRVVTSTDGRNIVLAHTYDTLGRKATLRDGSVTGTVRAAWTYDTVAKGQLASSTRYVGTDAYTYEVQSYSARYKPGIVRYTLPASETGFGNTSFSITNTYYADGSPATVRMPAAGGLGLETLTYGYDGLGQPSTLNTNLGGTLVTATGYTNYGEANIITLRNNGGGIAQVGYYYENDTRRLHEIKTTSAVAPVTTFADVVYGYDDTGNVTSISDSVSNDHQCFDVDYGRRLVEAWTPASGNCAIAPTVAGLGGSAKYWKSWSVNAVGNRTTQVDHAAANTTSTYTYPASGAGAVRPHAVGSVALTGATTRTDGYSYDNAGNIITRPGGAAGQTLTWDAEGYLASTSDSTGNTSYIYDADGTRLISKDAAGKTLYLPGQEVRYTNATTSATCTRYYSFAGKTIASRAPTGLSWLSSDHHDTQQLAINAVSQATTVRRQDPYGNPRGTVALWPNSKGFVGGTVDPTGLTHLGAREYDPTIGRFVSDDPVTDTNSPQQINGYAYANNNPATASDPGGLRPCDLGDDCRTGKPKNSPAPTGTASMGSAPACLAMLPNGTCAAYAGQKLPKQVRQGNLNNKSDQLALDSAKRDGASCEVREYQIYCFNAKNVYFIQPNPLVYCLGCNSEMEVKVAVPSNRCMTIGDVVMYTGSRDDFEKKLQKERDDNDKLLRRAFTMGDYSYDIDYYGQDTERHEAIHGEQWAKEPTIDAFLVDYGLASLSSYIKSGEPDTYNRMEIEANPYWGGYWDPPLPQSKFHPVYPVF